MTSTDFPTNDPSEIRGIIEKIHRNEKFSESEEESYLQLLEFYECWNAYFQLINQSMALTKNNAVVLSRYIRLARVQARYLGNVHLTAETAASLVKTQTLGFGSFKEDVLPNIVLQNDWISKATILQHVLQRFTKVEDQVACLEYLAMIYEKKIPTEQKLSETYERLLSVSPKNVKALRYFKLVFTQSADWEEVIEILQTLIEVTTHPTELFRLAQELAGIYLYQLDMPHDAVEVLEEHCVDSPLDTSNILYDAYERLANWDGCIRVLRQCLLNIDQDVDRAVLHFKIANLHEHVGDHETALDNYKKAAKLWPTFLEPVEGLINLNVSKKNWAEVSLWLNQLKEKVQNGDLSRQVDEAIKRLQNGLQHEKKQ